MMDYGLSEGKFDSETLSDARTSLSVRKHKISMRFDVQECLLTAEKTPISGALEDHTLIWRL